MVLVRAGSGQLLGCLCFRKARAQTSHRPPAKPLPPGSLTPHCNESSGGDAAVPGALCTVVNLPVHNWAPDLGSMVLGEENTLEGEKSDCGMQVGESRYGRDKGKEGTGLKTNNS